MFKKAQEKTDAVSPVIGVILLVAVTVALVALATVIVFDIGSDVSDTADATVQLEQQGNNMTATVIRNENVDTFEFSATETAETPYTGTLEGDNTTAEFSGDVGTTASVEMKADDSVSIVANLAGGNSEVLTSSDYVAP
jgi:flagellin-like protein